MSPVNQICVVPAGSPHALRAFSIALLRNRLASRLKSTILLPSRATEPWLHDWWEDAEHPDATIVLDVDHTADPAPVDFALISGGATRPILCREALLLPGGDASRVLHPAIVTQLHPYPGVHKAILVSGTGATKCGRWLLTKEALLRLEEALRLAALSPCRLVILSGWGGKEGGISEAEQMHQIWSLDTPVVLETAARTTAENAVCATALLTALDGVEELVVVASWGNALRQALLTRAAIRGTAIRMNLRVLWGWSHATSIRPGVVGLFFMRRHMRKARRLLRVGADT